MNRQTAAKTDASTPSVLARHVRKRPGEGRRRGVLSLVAVAAGVSGALLGGCAARQTYSLDIRNQTPQPLFVKMSETTNMGQTFARGEDRLGPGDRREFGPFHADSTSVVNVSLDTLPNPRTPVLWTLRPGANVLEVRQTGDRTAGPLEVRELR
jgi:hypothetical protein